MISKQILLQHDKLFSLLETNIKFYLNLALNRKKCVIKHFINIENKKNKKIVIEKEKIINNIWNRCFLLFMIMIKSKYIRSKTLSLIISQKNYKKFI